MIEQPLPVGRVRRLNADELTAYDLLPAALAARVRVVRIPAMPGPYAGITFGPVVCLATPVPSDGWSRLLAHELVHVRQWSEHGAIRFTARYLVDFVGGLLRTRSWQQAYREIDAEVEARALTDEWHRRRVTRAPNLR